MADTADPDPLSADRRKSGDLNRQYALERRQTAYLALRDDEDELHLIELRAEVNSEYAIGRDRRLDVALPWDGEVSSVHASIRLLATVWVLDDAGSHNGTFVNGVRLTERHRLANRDLIQVGQTVLAYRAAIPPGAYVEESPTKTVTSTEPPVTIELNKGERAALQKLCAPLLLAEGLRSAPVPSNKAIAQELHMSVGTVKSHLKRVAEKLVVDNDRDLIAREAVRRQVITLRDVSS